MLEAAAEKSAAAQLSLNFIQADMREFVLPREVGLVVAFQDGLNYLLTEEDLRRTMQAVHKALQPGGLFIFDINRVEKLAGTTGSSHVETEEFTLIWESSFLDPDVWEISVTGFVPAGDGLYRRFSERHKERVISMAEVCSALRSAGLTLRAVHKAFSLKPPDDEAQRVFFVAGREKSICM
jgi:SAM-dependent methyltransferase